MIRQGDKFLCKKDIKNYFGDILFKAGNTYDVLYVDNEQSKTIVVLNHVLIANEYAEWELEWVVKNFKKVS